MYLSRLHSDTRDRDTRRALGDCHLLHQMLMRAFPTLPDEPNPRAAVGLLYRIELARDARVCILAQSRSEPDWSRLPAWFDDIEMKPVAPAYDAITTGRVLAFRLRANPTRKVDTKTGPDGQRRNGRRVALVREDEQIAWLRRKGDLGGFALLDVRTVPDLADVWVTPGDRVTGVQRAAADHRRLTFGSVLFEGRLRVTDAALLRAALTSGIGSAKAFGFGLLSIAPASG